jgi:hypothetical protein
MLYYLFEFCKVVIKIILFIATVVMLLLALPRIIEQATSDNQDQPYSGATPDCPLHIDDEPWVAPTSREDVE